jgi:Phosphotransferase enzyme family
MLTQVFRYQAELMSARFDAIGSIYHRAEDNTFFVGPMGPSVRRPLNHTIDRGPWTSTRDWFKAYVISELDGIQNDPNKYRETRNRYKLDNGNPPFAYHVAWLKTLLATIDGLEYLRSIPAEVDRPVLFHEDLSGGNILFSYPDPNKLVGIIDFEGARVIPLWSAMDDPICCLGLDDTDSLVKLRLEILCQADPACAQVQLYFRPLGFLRWLTSSGITMWCSIERVHETYASMREEWPIHEPAFTALDELVALGPSGYVSSD